MTIRKAVLPVAGLGTRFLPATKAQPKEMLPIVDKPLVQYGVEEVAASGIPTVIFVTGRGKNSIEDHFDVSFELERMLAGRSKVALLNLVRSISNLVEIIYVRQKNPLGLGHAILMARDLVGNEPFAVLLSDDIIDAPSPCLKQMMDVFERTGKSVVALQRVDKQAVSSYGIIQGAPVNDPAWPKGSIGKDRLYLISDMVEKPDPTSAPSNLAIIGRYILTPSIFKELSSTRRGKGSEIQLTDALCSLLRKEPVYGYLFEGNRYDAGDKLGFLEATVQMALKRPELGPEFKKYLKALKL
ncbi:MAG TPA: UTP--glucose-1-phosphate uridylyltransferase GalU [Terriglobia bacterium]|nr:UTP--glucose-1-phosphate uridylyltransferase GalU [Terriglobia bacterium]